MNYQEAEARLIDFIDEDEDEWPSRVLSAWELPDAFIFDVCGLWDEVPYFCGESELYKVGKNDVGDVFPETLDFDDATIKLLESARRIV